MCYCLYSYEFNFVYREVDHLNCDEEKINKSMPAFWGFLGNATFSGNKTIKHRNIEIWTFETVSGFFFKGNPPVDVGVFFDDF